MKKLILIAAIFMAGCGERATVGLFSGPAGADGANGSQGPSGPAGSNGHSLVSQYMPASELECDSEGGSRLDIYVDLDDSLSASEGDLYQNSLVVCNGSNGNNGENGHDGIAGPPGSSGPPGLDGNPGHDGLPGPSGAPGTPGAPGSNGNDGAPGKDAHVTSKNVTESCGSLTAGYDALIKNNTVELYTAGKSCAAPFKVFVLTSSASTFWVSSTELAVFVDPAGVRILNYN